MQVFRLAVDVVAAVVAVVEVATRE